jgi:hypothetical protein
MWCGRRQVDGNNKWGRRIRDSTHGSATTDMARTIPKITYSEEELRVEVCVEVMYASD